MDLDLAAQPGRTAGTDAERRAAVALARALRAGRRRDAHLEPFRVRPGWQLAQAVCAALGVAGSVGSVDHPVAGAALAAAGLVLAALDLAGLPGLRLLLPARATQSVVSPAPSPGRVALIVTAAVDAPRRGIVRRVPAPEAWQLAALALVTLLCASRVAGAEGVALGAVQLAPTAVLVLLVGGWMDEALAQAPRDGSAAAAVVALAEALDARPPRSLGVEVVLAGAGGVRAAGLRRRLRRDGRRVEETAVLHLEPCAAGRPVWLRAAHPQLARAAQAAGAQRARGGTPALRAARARRRPAVALAARGTEPAGEAAVRATVDVAVALVRALDDELSR